VKKIRFQPNVQAEVRQIEQKTAMNITIVFFDESEDTVTVHRIRARRDVYR
jgi:hypothetical protein